jgi:hypothetical protein
MVSLRGAEKGFPVRVPLVAAALLIVAVAVPASAGTLNFEGSLSLNLGSLPVAAITGTGVATVNGSSGLGHLNSLQLPATFASGHFTMPVSDPGNPITEVEFQVTNLTGSFTGGSDPGALGGPMGIAGFARLCAPIWILKCAIQLTIPFTENGTRGIGLGGPEIIAQEGIFGTYTVLGAEWTVGTAQITGISTTNGGITTLTSAGFAHGPASGTTSTTGLSGGALQLVSPVIVKQNQSVLITAFAKTNIRFVPEPGLLLLLASGVAGLSLLGRRRTHR